MRQKSEARIRTAAIFFNFLSVLASLQHFRVSENESERCVRSSLEFHIAPAQDRFSKEYSGVETG
ncbi:hypothetical protein ACWAUC_24050 [Bradyrhizobium guangdongense]